LLVDLQERKQDAASRLFEVLYGQLREIARRQLRKERPDQTLQATALVNEAYLRLVGNDQPWQNRVHFFAVAASAMRRILIDRARAKRATKRPSSHQRVDLNEAPMLSSGPSDGILALDRALDKLSHIDARQGRIVEMRYFGGLTADEIAGALGISVITVQRDWRLAKAWLRRELSEQL
jgi:RNA polymerase sigma-70 factor (ECF subfamily)